MPWGMEYFNTGDPSFDYPAQESYQQNLASSFAPLFGPQNTPALNTYQSYLTGMPKPEDYQGGFMQKLLAGIAGLSAGIKDPAKGIQTAYSTMDAPYLRALQQYQTQEPGLRQAATIEERQLNDKNAFLKALQQQGFEQRKHGWERDKFEAEQELEKQKLNNAFNIAKMNAANDEERNRISAEHYKALEGLSAQMNSIRQFGEENDYRKILGGYELTDISGPTGGYLEPIQKDPNSSMINMNIKAALSMYPQLKKKIDSGEVLSPQEQAFLQQLYSEAGLR